MGEVTWEERLEETVIAPTRGWSKLFIAWIAFLVAIMAVGFVGYFYQWRDGLFATGMRDRIPWGLYIAGFIYFAGISMAGTLISAILRVASAGWRNPITRISEAMTAIGLLSGSLFIIVDMGRPDRLYQFWINGNWQSPLLWDMVAITIYLTASVVYLYVPMIPDLALFRDRLDGKVHRLQSWAYKTLSVGWTGQKEQRHALEKAVGILMIALIPVAASVHTVVSWIFATTTRISWDSTIFGFLFVGGAIYSGIAALIVVLAVLRRVYHLEEYITKQHFLNLGYLLAALALVMLYINANEYITTGYKMPEEERYAFEQMFAGDFATLYWFYFFGGLVVPLLIVAIPYTRNLAGLMVASVLVLITMFIERYLIIIPGFEVPLMPYEPATYSATWVEWSIVATGFAGFALLLSLFTRFFPILAVWEMVEEHEKETEPPAESAKEEVLA